jgi:hypothetical protein
MLSMMVYADELNPASDIPEFDDLDSVELTDREREMAEQLIESLAGEFDPERYHDSYREELMDLINAKASGATPALDGPEAPADDVVVDLMAALEKSVAAAREARGRHPSAAEGGADAADERNGGSDEGDGTGGGGSAGPRSDTADSGSSNSNSKSKSKAKAKPRSRAGTKTAAKKKAPARKTAKSA